MNANSEPHFLLEALSRWDMNWRLSQTSGRILLPIPQDFHSNVEAVHHVRRLSEPHGCTLVVRIGPDGHDGATKESVIEIHQPAARFSTPATK